MKLNVQSGKSIIQASQVQLDTTKLQQMEERSTAKKMKYDEETVTQAPVFTTSPKNIEILEGQRAHFEARLIPVSDETMRVHWYKNGEPIATGSRINEILSFGYVALDILQCTDEDIGTYTCRAVNVLGEAVTQANLMIHTRAAIDRTTNTHEATLQNLQYLEQKNYRASQLFDEAVAEAPMFTVPVRDVRSAEMKNVHFEARLIPVGDSNLKTEWYKDDVPLQASNRISTVHDFGFVSLDIKQITRLDEGVYTCKASNNLGQALTSARLTVGPEQITALDNEDQLQKLRYLEDKSQYDRRLEEEISVKTKPVFITELNTARRELYEQGSAHLEARIEPYPDSQMRITWEKDGQPLNVGSRFKPIHDFGFAALDVAALIPEDAGMYTCRATNAFGEATSSCPIQIKCKILAKILKL